MNRVTKKMLEAQVESLNEDLIPQIHHQLHWAYGGVKLTIQQPRGGYVDALYTGCIPKKELSKLIDAYERGMILVS